VPGSAFLRDLLTCVGFPLPATSLNLSGERPTRDPAELSQPMLDSIDLLLDAGPLAPGLPSTIVDLTGGEPRILRSGALLDGELIPYLKTAGGARVPTEG